MDDNKKVTFSDREIEGIAKAIALADLAARSPKEKNPSIPMWSMYFLPEQMAAEKAYPAI